MSDPGPTYVPQHLDTALESEDSHLRWVIWFVGILALTALAAIAFLAYAERPIPDVLENIGVASVTGLVALLAGRTQR